MTDRPTDGRTDKAGCRVACTRLKTCFRFVKLTSAAMINLTQRLKPPRLSIFEPFYLIIPHTDKCLLCLYVLLLSFSVCANGKTWMVGMLVRLTLFIQYVGSNNTVKRGSPAILLFKQRTLHFSGSLWFEAVSEHKF